MFKPLDDDNDNDNENDNNEDDYDYKKLSVRLMVKVHSVGAS